MNRRECLEYIEQQVHLGATYNDTDDLFLIGLREGALQLQHKAKFRELRKWKTWPIIQYRPDYELPNDFVDAMTVTKDWELDEPLLNMEDTQLMLEVGVDQFDISDEPTAYKYVDLANAKYIRIYDRPSLASASTTIPTGSNITDSDTELTVNDSSEFPKKGRITVETEIIEYDNNNTTTNEFTGLRRGMEGTTAASHAATVTVTDNDLQLFYFCDPPVLTADTDEWTFPRAYHFIPCEYALYLFYKRQNENEMAEGALGRFLSSVEATANMTARDRLDRQEQIIDPANYGWRI